MPNPAGTPIRAVTGLLLVLASCLVLSVTGAFARDHHRGLVLAVRPYLPAPVVRARFSPLARYLAEKTGVPVKVRVGRSYEELIRAVGQDKVDVAFIGPMGYVKLTESYGPKPLLVRIVTKGSPYFSGRIVVRSSGPIKRISDLRGKRIAFVDPDSTMGYVVPMYILAGAGLGPGEFKGPYFLGSHVEVARRVLSGDFDAGAVKEDVYLLYRNKGLRSIATTPLISEHLFVTRRDLPEEVISRLRQALFDLNSVERGHGIMRAMRPSITGMTSVRDSDYDNLRAILRYLEAQGVLARGK